jgi:alpha-galactosidase
MTPRLTLDHWLSGAYPFSFRYGEQPSSELLSTWPLTHTVAPWPGGEVHTFSWTDPATGLTVRAEVKTFADFPAVEWVLFFRADGPADTAIIEDLQALDWSPAVSAPHGGVTLQWSRGSRCAPEDFELRQETLCSHNFAGTHLGVTGGRGSDGDLPYFNLTVCDEAGSSQGVILALGWTGGWQAFFAREGDTLSARAGMTRTRLYLHPGEEIRSPRMLALEWVGDRDLAHNQWRRLILAHYTPQPRGELLPVCLATWGTDRAENHAARARALRDLGVELDVYWIDAGWYGPEPYQENASVFNTNWWQNQGNWWPSPDCYPEGLAPVGEAVHQAGYQFLLWIEPEVAKDGTELLIEHPEWFLDGFLLNLGDDTAREGITDIVSGIITQAGLDWYRQDFNKCPDTAWAHHDEPDREGLTEIRYITGLYAFWDELQRRHPGLLIDNCSSGGRRIDLETNRRSIPLWRTDLYCFPFPPEHAQAQTQGLAAWVPLSGCCCAQADLYSLRSCYGAGLVVDGGCALPEPIPLPWLAEQLAEYRLLRPYFTGDFYPLLAYSQATDVWTAWQFDRPDLAAGCALFFRRPDSPFASLTANLRALDPAATYAVELRHDCERVETCSLTGAELSALTVTLPEPRTSLVVTYRQE